MGQKINPTGFRLAVSRDWSSRWYANNRDFAGMKTLRCVATSKRN